MNSDGLIIKISIYNENFDYFHLINYFYKMLLLIITILSSVISNKNTVPPEEVQEPHFMNTDELQRSLFEPGSNYDRLIDANYFLLLTKKPTSVHTRPITARRTVRPGPSVTDILENSELFNAYQDESLIRSFNKTDELLQPPSDTSIFMSSDTKPDGTTSEERAKRRGPGKMKGRLKRSYETDTKNVTHNVDPTVTDSTTVLTPENGDVSFQVTRRRWTKRKTVRPGFLKRVIDFVPNLLKRRRSGRRSTRKLIPMYVDKIKRFYRNTFGDKFWRFLGLGRKVTRRPFTRRKTTRSGQDGFNGNFSYGMRERFSYDYFNPPLTTTKVHKRNKSFSDYMELRDTY